MLKPFVLTAAIAGAVAATATAAKTLDIYFVDVEGGQSTLIVTPQRQSLLVDAGFTGKTFAQGNVDRGRDAKRIVAVARAAGVSRIDYLLITHFHEDHDGGAPDLAKQLPIRTFVDHGTVGDNADSTAPGTTIAFDAYVRARGKARHLEPRPGDRLPLRGVEALVVSSKGEVEGGGCANGPAVPAQEPHENPRSTGILLTYGAFRFLDVGDLTGDPLHALACAGARIGPVSAYLVAHHGGDDAADSATFAAFQPRAAIVNNGRVKGGGPALLSMLAQLPKTETWQLHRSDNAGAKNFDDEHIANLDESTAHWLKLSANADGSFAVTNGRTKKTTELR